MPNIRGRLRAIARRPSAPSLDTQRGILAIAGVAALSIFTVQVWSPLPWAVVGVFLLLAARAPVPPNRPRP